MEPFTRIRNSSHDWSLKDDDALLCILENIHKDIIEKAANINEKYNERQAVINEAYISLLNTNNRFLELSNTQFIENKVQEDDIDFDMIERNDNIPKSMDKDEQDNKSNINQIILNSLNVLAENCEKIHISDTESCSEDNEIFDDDYNVILQPKDFYDQRLPYIIGSKKWHRKWHIGLEEYSSQSEGEDNVSDGESAFSSSDESIKDDNDTSNQSFKHSGTIAVKNDITSYPFENNSFSDQSSLYKNSTQNIISQENDEIVPSILEKPSDFAAELSKKFNSQTSDKFLKNDRYNLFDKKQYDPNIKKPNSKLPSMLNFPSKNPGINIFSDEPPPLEKMSNDDDKSISSISENCNDYTSDASSRNSPNIFSSSLQKTSEDVLFKSYPQGDIRNINMDIGSDNYFTDSINRNSLEEKDSNKQEEKVKPIPKNKPTTLPKNNATVKSFLFEDSEDDDDDIFGFSKKSKVSDIIRQQINENTSAKKSIASVPKSDKSMSLFDHSSDSDNDLFSPIKSKEDLKTNKKSTTKESFIKTDELVQDNIFNSAETKVKSFENNNTTYKKDKTSSNKNVEKSHKDSVSENQTSNFNSVLFEDIPPPLNDDDDDVDDIFSNIKNFGETITSNYDDIFGDNLFNNSDKNDIKKTDIFSDTPPEYPKDDYVIADDNQSVSDSLYNDNDSIKTHVSKEFSINVQSDTVKNSFVENELTRNTKNTINSIDNKNLNNSDTHIITGELLTTVKTMDKEHKKENNNEKIKNENSDRVINEDRSKQVSKNVSGKIQSNIVIDVKALLPGNKTIKKINENIEKLKNSANENYDDKIIDHDDTDSKNVDSNDNKSPTLNDKAESSILCNSILKERVKIQVKRRPSSRKARQEAIKSANNIVIPKNDVFSNNALDLYLKDDVDIVDNKDLKSESPGSTNLISTFETTNINRVEKEVKSVIDFNKSSDLGSLFSDNRNVLQNVKKNEQKIIVTPRQKKAASIFEESDSDSDLFVKGRKKEKPSNNTFQKINFKSATGKSLFDDDDSDDLFSTKRESTNTKKNTIQKKGSLFDDSDNDIFKPEKESKHKTTAKNKSHENKKLTKSNVKDNETRPSFEDPLSSFLNN